MVMSVTGVHFAMLTTHRFVYPIINLAYNAEQVTSVIRTVKEVVSITTHTSCLAEVKSVEFGVLCGA